MDAATAGLIGVGVGGLATVATGFVTPWVTARQSAAVSTRESEQRKRDSLEAVLDEAGLALEAFHWALYDVLDAEESGESRAAHERVIDAQADASRQGTRLAIRLGPPSTSPCVAAYNARQDQYRDLVRKLRPRDGSAPDVRALQEELLPLGQEEALFQCASGILKPTELK